jgi:hypothetical protein
MAPAAALLTAATLGLQSAQAAVVDPFDGQYHSSYFRDPFWVANGTTDYRNIDGRGGHSNTPSIQTPV